MTQRWSAQAERNVGLRALNERINQVEALIEQMPEQAIFPIPPVVQFDGIWVTIQRQAEKVKQESKKGTRKERTGNKQGTGLRDGPCDGKHALLIALPHSRVIWCPPWSFITWIRSHESG